MPEISYTHGVSETPLIGDTIGENLRKTVDLVPENEALVAIHQNFRATYREFWDLTTKIAKGLLVFGIEKGDRVGIWSPNRYEWVVIQYATARIGAIMVNINPAYRTSELEFALNQSAVNLLLSSRSFRKTDYLAMLDKVMPLCPELRQVIIIDTEWDQLIAAGENIGDSTLATIEKSLQFDDAINIQYTSGTTGFPKGATLSHHNLPG